MNMKQKKVLILAPHTDDGELGCGGTINRMIEEGSEVYYLAFSACEQSVLKEFPSDILITEVKAATSKLGIQAKNLILLKYEVRTFNFRRQDILNDMIYYRNLIKPDLVFMPCSNDVHQDHETIYKEGIRAFKFCSILCYELPWNNFSMNTSMFVKLEDHHIQAKADALMLYKSQSHRPYANEIFLKSLAITRGTQVETKYAEAFEIKRILY
jgi:LmbE family N-acetylglucosaminyl deacetylase